MPNPNPVRRQAAPRVKADTLPPGFDRMADGRYRYRFTVAGIRQRPLYGLTVDECLAKRYAPPPVELTSIVDDGTTLAEYLETWLKGLTLRANSIATHRQQVDGYLVPLFGSTRIVDVTPPVIRERMAELRTWRTKRGNRPLAAGTVKLAWATLRKALGQWSVDRNVANPCRGIKPLGASGRASRSREIGAELAIPSELDLGRMRRATIGTVRGRAAMLTVLTGLRQSELLALAESDVDAGYVHVRQRLDRTTRTLDDPKNATSARYIPLGTLAATIVDDQRAWLRSAALRPGWRGNPAGLLFVDDAGGPLVGSTLTRWYGDALARAGIEHHRWHDLRHYYASNLLNRGVPIPVVSKLLGHRDATITTRVYHHILKPDTLASAAVAEQAFAAPDLRTPPPPELQTQAAG